MHELAICQSLMSQVEAIVRERHATRVTAIVIGVGPLSGVEQQLLKNAYPIASAGTVAENAELLIRSTPVRVRCTTCGEESEVKPNRLVCGHCGDWRTELLCGDELLLVQLELEQPDPPAASVH